MNLFHARELDQNPYADFLHTCQFVKKYLPNIQTLSLKIYLTEFEVGFFAQQPEEIVWIKDALRGLSVQKGISVEMAVRGSFFRAYVPTEREAADWEYLAKSGLEIMKEILGL